MQRRIRPQKLQENYYGTLFPKPTEKVVDVSTLDGGLNLWELEYRLDPNQSPDLLNVYWKDGCLKSRPGQAYIYQAETDEDFIACYERLWQGYVIAHKGTKLYKIGSSTGTHTEIFTGLTNTKGAGFFVFGDTLYYLGGGKYIAINESLVASEVTGYIPTVIMGRTPAGTGGSEYQPENRIASGKKVLFTSDGTSTVYQLPYTGIESTVIARTYQLNSTTQTYEWVTRSDITVDATNGTVTFDTAPTQESTAIENNVEITCYKENTDAKNSILTCTCLSVYGGDSDLAVVVGGPTAQPNAYFWSGNTDVSLDPTYFPFDYYNLAGADSGNAITGLAKQQGLLIILQNHSVGKTSFDETTINNRVFLTLNYTAINSFIGCDVPGSIQLITNNLCFANTYSGVYVLADSSAANENNVRRLSRNVNGTDQRGLLLDLANKSIVTSFDDNERYWLIIDGKAYLWDYSIRGYSYKEENLAWFYFNNINACGVYQNVDDHFYFTDTGSMVKFTPDSLNDFGAAIQREYVFATQIFGTYQVLKDVMKIVFAVKSDTDSVVNIKYRTDYEERDDRTPISISAPKYSWVPRNLAKRNLGVNSYAYTTVRIPRCPHIQHFTMTLSNNTVNTDIGLVGAQIFYRYVREIR